MPPRLGSTRLTSKASSSSSTLTAAARPSTVACTQRQFSQTSSQQVTRRRREFYQWLNGPGRQLRKPLPNSTNYLGAWDKYGNLVRAPPTWERKTPEQLEKEEAEKAKAKAKAKADAIEKAKKEGEEGKAKTPAEEEKPDDLEASVRRDEEKAKAQEEQDPNYLPQESEEDLQPFPLNRYFRSQPVLSEALREEIYQRVTRDGATVSLASVEFGVSNERVGAVVRLKQLEKEWIAQGKQLAQPYAKAVLQMLPQTPFIDQSLPENKNTRPIPHEPINDLIVHPATRQQLFVPVAESRKFTREDAGKAFANDLLPADARIPHPELVQAEREIAEGLPRAQREQRAVERFQKEQAAKAAAEAAKKAEEARSRNVVPQRRWDYVFTDVSVERAGKDGRGVGGVGWRYGFPHEDRKKGQVKIPTKVDA
ncbi:hypothetical protein BU24DRAFT_419447 [Aaosphaeria arxii CBS 175.79]|uniref:Eukaryotic mitochondrial regulator protein-domain-containing protein n=1 Tax=Aaosphaeria arxii CBS 175.79 TaxID=1450172 RepID=A0A6A5Y3P0_9PLEO|nr:uncharacterized protein BU24DRAFT_419447 [Aaosphaeria arxii CBS 175.79]KAF2019833.1 hypothetical protein BU24DRAFT_419447 [Aaosphaeria arxii CBS 175.79]